MSATDRPFPRRTRLPGDAYRDREAVFHVIVRAFRETVPFRGELARVIWGFVCQLDSNDELVPLAACLMPDHLHLMVSPGTRDLRARIGAVKSYTTWLARPFGAGRLWQPSFYDRRLRAGPEFETALAYLWGNPVEAGLVEDADDWPYTKLW